MKKQIWLVLLALILGAGTAAADRGERERGERNRGSENYTPPQPQSPPVTDQTPASPPEPAPEVATPTDPSPAPVTDPPANPPADPGNNPGNNGNGQEMITLCHVVPKTPHSITVAEPAKVQAHLDHGDTVGGCDNEMAAPAAGLGSVITLCSQNGGGTGHQLTVSPVGRVSHIRITCD